MNLGEIELKIYDRLGFNATPDSAVIRRIRGYVNDAHREALTTEGFEMLRRRTLTCASVTNSPYMVLPQAATAVIIISDRLNNRNLVPVSLHDIRYRDPGLNFSSSIPDSFAILNFASTVARDPSAAASLFVISDAAADGSGLAVNIEGVTTGGYFRTASVALNGLTGVNIDANCSTWEYVTKFYISGQAAGNVTLREGSGVGNELSRIVKGKSYPRYTTVHLSPTPGSVYTYYCDVVLHLEEMQNVTDEPLLQEDYHTILINGALMREYMKREKMSEFRAEEISWRAGLRNQGKKLRVKAGVSTGGQRGNNGRQYSQLGSQFPSGS